jgi:hypothetical protein
MSQLGTTLASLKFQILAFKTNCIQLARLQDIYNKNPTLANKANRDSQAASTLASAGDIVASLDALSKTPAGRLLGTITGVTTLANSLPSVITDIKAVLNGDDSPQTTVRLVSNIFIAGASGAQVAAELALLAGATFTFSEVILTGATMN